MKLDQLLKNIRLPHVMPQDADLDIRITSVCSRAQDITPGGLFIAIKGYSADGHDFIDQAVENGCAAIVSQKAVQSEKPVIIVEDTRSAMAHIACAFYRNPSKDMVLTGITGTNGKTTITFLLEHILRQGGFNPGIIGTVNIRYNDKTENNPVTTPDSIDLQAVLARMRDAGVTHVILEVSSHGIDLHRIDGCHFDVGVFTNLSQDHLDFHPDMTDYFECKKSFFTRHLSNTGHAAVVNLDDPKGKIIQDSLSIRTIGTGTSARAAVTSHDVIDDISGLRGTLLIEGARVHFSSLMTGRFNLENILSAAGAAHALGIAPETIAEGIRACRAVPGRLEKVFNTANRYVFVDYAHTPAALGAVLDTLKKRAPRRLITVFGCGGDRDRSKRPQMAQMAEKYSDLIIITSDNPRQENPDLIIRQILEGISCPPYDESDGTGSSCCYLIEPDRRRALETAIALSRPLDIVIAAGKGHETYQITAGGTIHFDDRIELAQALKRVPPSETDPSPIPFSIEDIQTAIQSGPVICNLPDTTSFAAMNTDSRSIRKTDCFIALKGPNFNAASFITELAAEGIQGFIAPMGFSAGLAPDEKAAFSSLPLILFEVENTLEALGKLANYQRSRAGARVAAITGSNGKTTTRQMIQDIFSRGHITLATRGNRNNEVGLPLTLLKLSSYHKWAIVEMGMNHAGEISRLSKIAAPDIAVITNISLTHLEGLGTIDNIAAAKAEIFDHMSPDSTVVLNSDDSFHSYLQTRAAANPDIRHIITFGTGKASVITASNIRPAKNRVDFELFDKTDTVSISLNTPAPFMVMNALAACAAGRAAGLDLEAIADGLADFSPVPGRLQPIILPGQIHLIDDTYNASPASMAQALNTLKLLSRDNPAVAVLGDMLELGEKTAIHHEVVGRIAAASGIDRLYLHGNHARDVMNGALQQGFAADRIISGSKTEIARHITGHIQPGTWILVKGSRGMAMEEVIHKIQQMQEDK